MLHMPPPMTASSTTHDSTTLVCPKCQVPMEKVEFARISVDRCPTCDGLWFDDGEVERLKGLTGSESIDSGTNRAKAAEKAATSVLKMKCPRCSGPMTTIQDAEQPHIEYEMCQDGHGTFFDAGEFRDFKEVTLLESIKMSWRNLVGSSKD